MFNLKIIKEVLKHPGISNYFKTLILTIDVQKIIPSIPACVRFYIYWNDLLKYQRIFCFGSTTNQFDHWSCENISFHINTLISWYSWYVPFKRDSLILKFSNKFAYYLDSDSASIVNYLVFNIWFWYFYLAEIDI